MENYYQTLGVSYTATEEEIKIAYKQKAKIYHPDVSKIANAAEIFKKINHAKDILLDANKRLQLDYYLGVKVNPEPENSYYNNNQYGGYQQPQQQESGNNAWWMLLLLLVLALIFGSSNNKDRRY